MKVKWRTSDMAYRMGHLVTYYNNAYYYPTIMGKMPSPDCIREYVKIDKEITEHLGVLRRNLFLDIKKNGYIWDDISGLQKSGVTDNNAYIEGWTSCSTGCNNVKGVIKGQTSG